MAINYDYSFPFVEPKRLQMRTAQVATREGDICRAYQVNYADVNRNNEYDAGDSVLISDINKDGKYDYRDAEATSKLLNLLDNPRDPNLDGSAESFGFGGSSDAERAEGRRLMPLLPLIDPNGDGKVGSAEVGVHGMRLARDLNGDGQFAGADFDQERIHKLLGVIGGRAKLAVVPEGKRNLGVG